VRVLFLILTFFAVLREREPEGSIDWQENNRPQKDHRPKVERLACPGGLTLEHFLTQVLDQIIGCPSSQYTKANGGDELNRPGF
jgi:hypothetical protein